MGGGGGGGEGTWTMDHGPWTIWTIMAREGRELALSFNVSN